MNRDMNTQVREYTEFFQGSIDPVEMEEILHRRIGDGPVRPIRPVRSTHRRGWVTAAVAAVVTVVVLGSVAWLSRSDGAAPAVDETPPTTAAVTPTTEAVTTTDTVAATTTTLAAVPAVPPGEGPQFTFAQGESPVEGILGGGVWFNSALYVTSHHFTAYDVGDSVGNTVFRSPDGLTWERVPGLPIATNVGRSMLYTDGDRLVNVVVKESDNSIEVNTSIDGEDWVSSRIQIPIPGGSNMVGVFEVDDNYPFSDNVAVGPKGIVVAATVNLSFEGEGFANGLVGADEATHVEVVDLDLDRGTMIVRFLDENNGMEQIGDDREIDLQDAGFSNAFSNLLDAMASDPDWEPVIDGFIAQLTDEATDGYAAVSVGYAWHSPDGETWNRVERAGPLDGGEFSAIMATPDGFMATAISTYQPGSLPLSLRTLATGFDSTIVWESEEGTDWIPAPDLTSSYAFNKSRLAEWQGKPVELVGWAQRRQDDTSVFTLTVPSQDLTSEIPTSGMLVEIGELGLIGTPTYGWEEPGKMEILLSLDGTTWNRWQPDEFGTVDGQAEAWIVGIGDDFVVLQVTELDDSGAFSGPSMWIGRLP